MPQGRSFGTAIRVPVQSRGWMRHRCCWRRRESTRKRRVSVSEKPVRGGDVDELAIGASETGLPRRSKQLRARRRSGRVVVLPLRRRRGEECEPTPRQAVQQKRGRNGKACSDMLTWVISDVAELPGSEIVV